MRGPSIPADAMPDLNGAMCRDMDPRLWDELDITEVRQFGSPYDAARIRVAISICEFCPVTAECLDFALATGQTGVHGGTYLAPEKRRRAA